MTIAIVLAAIVVMLRAISLLAILVPLPVGPESIGSPLARQPLNAPIAIVRQPVEILKV